MGLDMYLYANKKEVGYWRKANAIHGFFVREAQGGKDDCLTYKVERETLSALLFLCRKVKENPENAGFILPPKVGFFFGGYEIDDWYIKQVEYTIDLIEKLLALPGEIEFEYESSW